MGDCREIPWGARLERGTVIAVNAGEENTYDVASAERPGVTGYGLADMGGEALAEGSRVLFFLFEDGTGLILS